MDSIVLNHLARLLKHYWDHLLLARIYLKDISVAAKKLFALFKTS